MKKKLEISVFQAQFSRNKLEPFNTIQEVPDSNYYIFRNNFLQIDKAINNTLHILHRVLQ